MRVLYVLTLLIIFTSCERKLRPPKPENLISREEFSEILYDMFIINSAKGVNRKLLETNGIIPQQFILEKYKIDSLQFANSNDYYAFDFKDYGFILDKIESKISAQKKELEAIQEIEKKEATRKKDSIKKARQKALETSVKPKKS